MTRKLQILRGTTAQNNAYTGAVGELTMDTDRNEVRIHDGQTVGGIKIGDRNMPILTSMFFDHILNDISWLRADTFSWQSGDVYVAAYNHLADDIDGKTLQSETIGSTTIQFYLADDGHKICPDTEENSVSAIYNATGAAWYYIIDTASKRFKLPRKYKPKRELVKSYKNGSEWYNLYSDGWVEQGGLHNRSYSSTVNLLIRMSDSEYDLQLTVADIQRYANAYSRTDTAFAFTTADDSSANNDGNVMWIVSGYANDSELINIIDQQFEYYYVGNFEQSAVEQTAGITAETLNGKADADLGNIPTNYDYVVESQMPTADNGYTWYRKYKSGWVEQGGTSSSGVTVTLPVVMVDNSYTLVFGNDMYSENVGTAIIVYGLKTASSFLAQGRWNGGGTGGIGFSWHVSGMSAQ